MEGERGEGEERKGEGDGRKWGGRWRKGGERGVKREKRGREKGYKERERGERHPPVPPYSKPRKLYLQKNLEKINFVNKIYTPPRYLHCCYSKSPNDQTACNTHKTKTTKKQQQKTYTQNFTSWARVHKSVFSLIVKQWTFSGTQTQDQCMLQVLRRYCECIMTICLAQLATSFSNQQM